MPKIRKTARRLAFATAIALAWTGQHSRANDSFLAYVSQLPAAEEQSAVQTAAPHRLPPTTSAQPNAFDPHNALTSYSEQTGEAAAEEGTADSGDGSVSLEDYQTLLERVDEMESSWEGYQEKLDKAAADKKKKPSYKLNGRIHLDNWNFMSSDEGINQLETGDPTDDPENRWDFRRIRLTWTGDVPHNMLYRIQLDFNNPSAGEMKDVYLGFNNLPYNQTLLIGNQKRPIGLDHLNSSRHNVFAERPLAVETFNEDARRLGICMYGYTDNEVYHWRYGGFLLENISTDGRYRGDKSQAGFYGRLSSSPWYDDISGGRGYYHWALAGSANSTDGDGTLDADQNTNEARFRTRPLARSDSRWWNTGRILGAQSYQQLAVEQMLNIGALQITGEYFNTWVQRDALGGFSGDDLHFHGGYIFASYFLTGEYIPYKRTRGTIDRVKPLENFFLVERCRGGCGRGWGALALALRYDFLDVTDSDIQGGRGHAWTAGLNWYWTAYSKLQTNVVWGSIKDAGEAQFPSATFAGIDGDFSILGMRYMIDF
jgi:phosphate-selective porin OprO/OprP